MSQPKQVLNAIQAIRALDAIYPDDIAAICAVLSSKISAQTSSHPMMESAARDLDDLHNYISDYVGEV